MFRSSTIIRELALNLAKVIFTLKHWVKLRRYVYLLCGCVAACCSMLPHNRVINNDVISPNVLSKYDFSQVQCKLPDDSRRPEHVGAIFMCILMYSLN